MFSNDNRLEGLTCHQGQEHWAALRSEFASQVLDFDIRHALYPITVSEAVWGYELAGTVETFLIVNIRSPPLWLTK